MGRFRSFVHRALKPAAMVGVVGLLSLGLIVTTPATAQALTPKLPVTPTFIMGAAKTVAPVAMAAVSLTPVGWALRLGQLGFLAYSTADMWMPFVTGAFGNSPVSETVDPTQYKTSTGYSIASPSLVAGNAHKVQWIITVVGSARNTTTIVNQVQCRNNSTNVVSAGAGGADTVTLASGDSGYPRSVAACPVGSTVIAAKIGPSALPTNNFPGPTNMLTFGSVVGFDPLGNDVGYTGKSECIDSAGTTSWISGPQVPGDNGAMLMPSCEKAGKGHGTGRTKVEAFKPDGTTETVWDTGAQPLSDPATPLCDPGRTSSGCVLEVTKDGEPCKSGDVECENWSSESKKEGNTRYGCKLGPYTMPLSACSLLDQAYMPGGSPLNDQNTDGDPLTRSNLGPSGQPAPAASPTVTGTGTNPVPGGSGQTGPGAEESARQCWPTGWGMFNPMEWVLKPLRCAFEPTKDVSMIGQIFREKAEMKAPVSFLNLELIGPSGSGCPNWVISVPGFSQNVVCGSSFTAAILSIRAPLFGILATAMVWPLIRSLWYAAIPILRVTPSSGGK